MLAVEQSLKNEHQITSFQDFDGFWDPESQ